MKFTLRSSSITFNKACLNEALLVYSVVNFESMSMVREDIFHVSSMFNSFT